MNRKDVAKRFPVKVELHVHLDGAVRTQTILDIGQKRGIKLPASTVDGLNKEIVISYGASLDTLLASFHIFAPVFAGDRDAVYTMAYEFCEDCARQGIVYAEVRYSPHLLANTFDKPAYARESGSFSPRDVVCTVNEALEKGSRDFNITVKSILACIRSSSEWSKEVASLCKEFRNSGVVGIDIAMSEFLSDQHPDECPHRQAFLTAKNDGIHRTTHAGEVGEPANVYEALDDYYAERIGHGYRSILDAKLYERIKREGIHFETCPISSLKTAGASSRTDHPILRFATDGANFSINTDDPTVLGNDLTDDYLMALEFGLTEKQIQTSIFNAAWSSFASDKEKQEIIKKLVEVYGEN
ncbi:adenosine deaminase-like [Gigantopelta aegis]|uniref:adenosine deaminase-like n=1 Tax=Gigantopelta aegis TaxID=1735272 RepID=UPI001B8877E5|nr:adenosine deaminase-like [Gigantopelta aegis]